MKIRKADPDVINGVTGGIVAGTLLLAVLILTAPGTLIEIYRWDLAGWHTLADMIHNVWRHLVN